MDIENTEDKTETTETKEKEKKTEKKITLPTASGKSALVKLIGLGVLVVILIAVIAVFIVNNARKSYDVLSDADLIYPRTADSVVDLAPFTSGAVLLTSNAIEYVDQYGNLINANEHKFANPVMITAGKNLLLFDRGGSGLKIEKDSVKYKEAQFDSAVSCADITSKGTYAYVLNADGGYQSHLYVYSYKGKKLFEWGGSEYVLDVALSPNGNHAAVSVLSVSNAESLCKVIYFNFNKNEPIFTVEYPGETVYDIEFVSSKNVAVLTQSGSYLLNSSGASSQLNHYAANELNHSALYKCGVGVTAINHYGNTNNALVYYLDKGCKKTYEDHYQSSILMVTASESHAAVVFADEIKVLGSGDSVTGTVKLPETCIHCVISGRRLYVLSASGLYSFSIHETSGE